MTPLDSQDVTCAMLCEASLNKFIEDDLDAARLDELNNRFCQTAIRAYFDKVLKNRKIKNIILVFHKNSPYLFRLESAAVTPTFSANLKPNGQTDQSRLAQSIVEEFENSYYSLVALNCEHLGYENFYHALYRATNKPRQKNRIIVTRRGKYICLRKNERTKQCIRSNPSKKNINFTNKKPSSAKNE